jgi:hypothetical protein
MWELEGYPLFPLPGIDGLAPERDPCKFPLEADAFILIPDARELSFSWRSVRVVRHTEQREKSKYAMVSLNCLANE